MPETNNTLRRIVSSLALVLCWTCLTGFAPFKSQGLAIFRVADGEGLAASAGEVSELAWRNKETPALVHTLSSRYGGGGALVYMEYLADERGAEALHTRCVHLVAAR